MIVPFAVNVTNLIIARSFFEASIPDELLERLNGLAPVVIDIDELNGTLENCSGSSSRAPSCRIKSIHSSRLWTKSMSWSTGAY